MLSTIIAIIIALATGTTPAQPTTPNPNKKEKTTTAEEDPTMSTFGGVGKWTEGE